MSYSLKELLTQQKSLPEKDILVKFFPDERDFDNRRIHSDFSHENSDIVQEILHRKTSEVIAQTEIALNIRIRKNLSVEYYPGFLETNKNYRYLVLNRDSLFAGAKATISGNYKTIIAGLSSTTPLSSQIHQTNFVIPHEAAHLIFDSHYINGNSGYNKHLDSYGLTKKNQPFSFYFHNREYIADAGMAITIGEQLAKEYLKSWGTKIGKGDEEHPSSKQRLYAIENKIFYEPLLINLEKAKASKREGKEFNSWKDFLENKDKYISLQKSIIERT